MSEDRSAGSSASAQRRIALGRALASVVPGWHEVAEDLLGADSRIDWLGRDRDGRAVVALLAEPGEGLGLVARGLAQLDWVSARLADWVQLAPHAGLRPEAGAQVLLLATRFEPAALAAARAARGAALRLVEVRFLEQNDGPAAHLDVVAGLEEDGAGVEVAGFRTGLAPEDLDLTEEESAEFLERRRPI